MKHVHVPLRAIAAVVLAPAGAFACPVTYQSPAPLNTYIIAPGVGFTPVTAVKAGSGGTWIAAFSIGGEVGTDWEDDVDIGYRRSPDRGVTWSPLAPLNATYASDSSIADYSPDIATDGTGNWMAVWVHSPGASGFAEIQAATSANDGVSWSVPVTLAAQGAGHAGLFNPDPKYPRVQTDGLGNWVVIWTSDYNPSGTLGSDDDLFIARSTDFGQNWSTPTVFNAYAGIDGAAYDLRVALARGGSGTLVAAWATQYDLSGGSATDYDVAFRRSTDGGQNWSAVAALNTDAATDGGTETDGEPDVIWMGGSNWLAGWGAYRPSEGGGWDLLVSHSADSGATWSAPEYLNPDWLLDDPNESKTLVRLATDGGGSRVIATWVLNSVFPSANRIHSTCTSDGGYNWEFSTQHTPVGSADTSDDLDPVGVFDANGRIEIMWASSYGDGGGNHQEVRSVSAYDGASGVANWSEWP